MVSQGLVAAVVAATIFICFSIVSYCISMIPKQDLFLAVIAVIVFFLIFGCHNLYEKRRQKQLEKLSHEIGFLYVPRATIDLPDLKLFTIGRKKNMGTQLTKRFTHHLLTATHSFIKWSLFDYNVPVKGWPTQTVAMAQLDRELPEFYLLKEYFYNSTEEYSRFKDIDIEGYPGFSLRYHLKGKDDNAVRHLFTPHVILTILNENLRSNIEAKGNFIIIYTPKKRYSPEDLYRFIQTAKTIVDLFK